MKKTRTPDWILPAVHDESIAGYICLPVPASPEYRYAMLGALLSVTRWYTWERTGDNRGAIAANFFKTILLPVIMGDILETCGGGDTPQAKEKILTEIQRISILSDIEGCTMRIEKIGGIYYLEVVCGDCGGERLYFPLTSPASVNPTGGGIVASDEQAPKGSDIVVSPDAPTDCYKSQATDYLLGRFQNYAHAVLDMIELGYYVAQADELSPAIEYVYESFSKDEVRGDFEEVSKGTVDSLIATNRDRLVAAMPSTAPLNRLDMVSWANSSSIALRVLMLHWITNSVIAGYGGKLSAIAAQCNESSLLWYETDTQSKVGGFTMHILTINNGERGAAPAPVGGYTSYSQAFAPPNVQNFYFGAGFIAESTPAEAGGNNGVALQSSADGTTWSDRVGLDMDVCNRETPFQGTTANNWRNELVPFVNEIAGSRTVVGGDWGALIPSENLQWRIRWQVQEGATQSSEVLTVYMFTRD